MSKDQDIENLLKDDELFRPITEGLGFHHSLQEKKKLKTDLQHRSLELKKDLYQRKKELIQEQVNSNSDMDMGELAPFYKNEHAPSGQVQTPLSEMPLEESQAGLGSRLLAFSLDLLCIIGLFTLSLSAALALVIYTADVSVTSLSLLLEGSSEYVPLALMFLGFYTLYFSFFDKSQHGTLGKRVFGLRLKAVDDELTIMKCLLRALLSFSSLLTLGMVSLLKLEDKLSDTFVSDSHD